MNRTLALGFALALLCASCATTATPPAPAAASGLAKLSKGLSGAQVVALVGKPAATKPISAANLTGEIWTYPLKTETEVNSIPVMERQLPGINPITNVDITRSEPVYREQHVSTSVMLHLLMVDDRLVEWRVVRKQDGKFD